jgi:hypothetical protein
MKRSEDPRIKVSRRAFLVSWVFFSVYLMAVMAAVITFVAASLRSPPPRDWIVQTFWGKNVLS